MRRGYIDWLRGLAVLIMVEAHTLDSWTRAADRESIWFGFGGILGGFGAPLFLFLAGVAVMLAIGRRAGAAGIEAAAQSVQRRGWQIFGLAFLFRLQAKLLSGGGWRSLLRVDILNIMGPSIALAGWMGGRWRTTAGRLAAFGITTVAAAMATPLVRGSSWVRGLPDPVEGYLKPVAGLTNFTVFPWAGFVLAGAFAGVLLDRSKDAASERRLNVWLLIGGALLTAGGYGLSYLPSIYDNANFWTSSPAFFAMRVGILTMALPIAFGWNQLGPTLFSPIRQFGRTSLFIYWIHIEMVYGAMSRDLHRTLSLKQWVLAYLLFLGVLLAISLAKDALVSRWGRPRIVAKSHEGREDRDVGTLRSS
jgi:uncharacterized membrane protein